MCGICGVAGRIPAEAAEAAVRRMMAALAHRGPDDEGMLAVPLASVGMRRLSIIDLAGGHQPVSNEDGTLAVVLNGEIYNFRSLRRRLEDRGHVFRTQSDTEVVVHAYEEWGEDCVQHLQGMFAFAVVELTESSPRTARRLFLARDRFGIKPLYFALLDGSFVFASEVRALLASQLLRPRLSRSALRSYLLLGSVAEPATLVEGVASLPPGHRMSLPATGPHSGVQPERYWSLGVSQPAQDGESARPRDRREAIGRLRSLLGEAVRLHLIADVPLGVFLSSGIDSTALAALARRERSALHTFTVAFREQEFSEAALARRTAEKLGTSHQELLLGEEEMLARMDEAVAALDQPSMDGINTYFVSWAARQLGLKVALSGLGGDEVFGGYSTFRSAPPVGRLAAVARLVPGVMRSATATVLAAAARGGGREDAARKLAAAWRDPDALPHPYFFLRALFTPAQVAALQPAPSTEFTSVAGAGESPAPWWDWLEEAAQEAEQLDAFSAVSWLETRSYLVNTLLRDTDSMSMAHSLEVRVPFLDHLLVEYVARLPAQMKQQGRPKALLSEALEDVLPREVVFKEKQTFTLPWERWLRCALKERIEAGLSNLSPALQGEMDCEAVHSVWQDFLAGRTSWSRPWSLYVLNEWISRHLAAG